MESPARPVSFAVIYRHDDQYFTPAEYVAHCLAAGHVLPVELGGPVQVDRAEEHTMSKPVHTSADGTVHLYDADASEKGRPNISSMSSHFGRGTHLVGLEFGHCEFSLHDVTTEELTAIRDNLTAYLHACRAAALS